MERFESVGPWVPSVIIRLKAAQSTPVLGSAWAAARAWYTSSQPGDCGVSASGGIGESLWLFRATARAQTKSSAADSTPSPSRSRMWNREWMSARRSACALSIRSRSGSCCDVPPAPSATPQAADAARLGPAAVPAGGESGTAAALATDAA